MSRDIFKGSLISVFGAQPSDFPLLAYAGLQPSIISCPVSHSERYATAFEQLNVFSNLGNNWDGYGGVPISEQAIKHARTLLCTQLYTQAHLALPEITPTPNGTLVIEWQGRHGEAAVEIGNTRVSGVIKPENSPTICIAGETTTLSNYLPSFIAPFLNPERAKTAAITPVEYDAASNA
jgi:hypothetical protein